ncbi:MULTISPECIES: RNA polymerase sigma factor [unclassified Novosphingobium]|uniref:RNA polymerase sigma factor n=1 Tax=unclassified Novosphingobium TaxID=2644732 RepID=UPI0014043236|nr:sigma-70 family RNA polymerase sigma factor [Novosphingobium sp. ST904]
MSGGSGKAPASSSIEFAIEKLFRDERRGILRYLSKRVDGQDDAQDVLQEAFMRLVLAKPAALNERPEAYLQRVVQNVVIDRFRRSRNQPVTGPLWDDDDVAISVAPQQGWALEAEDAMEKYRRVLGDLPPRTREIFELNRVDALTYHEIAARYGVTVKAIEYHMSKALQHLHQAFYGE